MTLFTFCTCACGLLALIHIPLVPMFPPAPGGRHRTPFESSSSFEPPDLGGGVGGLGLEEAFTPEMREKMARLEKENEIMRRRLDSSNLTESLEPSLLGKFSNLPPDLKMVHSYLQYLVCLEHN